MNTRRIFLLAAALWCLLPNARAQSANAAPSLHGQIQAMVEQVQTKVAAGKTNEADFADELKTLDRLLADQNGAKTDDAALLAFMKAQLYVEVLGNLGKATNLLQQIKLNYPQTSYGSNADHMIVSLQARSAQQSIQAKISAGKTNAVDFAPDFQCLNEIIASEKSAGANDVPALTIMEAQMYLEAFQDFNRASNLVISVKTEFPDSRLGRNADSILNSFVQELTRQKVRSGLAVGSAFPDFSETDLAGKPLSVANRKGKVVLLDFWATWCPPCRAELPNVIQTYQKYHDRGLEIIGVSLDSDRAALDSFLARQTGMTWSQYYDGGGWTNKLALKYGVEAIPFTLLVGPDSRILGKGLHGEDLDAAVAKALRQ